MNMWRMDRAFAVSYKCPFEGTEQSTTVMARNAAEAISTWKVEYGDGINPVATATGWAHWAPVANPDFGEITEGYLLQGIRPYRWSFNVVGHGPFDITTWVRRTSRAVWNPNRDVSVQEASTLVPKSLLAAAGATEIVQHMLADEAEWQKAAAKYGQVYISDMNTEVARVTLVWELDLS
jgi:hypothetical protein